MITKIIKEDLIIETKAEFESADSIVLVSHTSPDGDAVGSTLALGLFLQSQGKKVAVIYPTVIPENLRWLPGAKESLIYANNPNGANELIKNADLICCLDFNELKRIGDMAIPVAEAPGKKLLIDHHTNPSSFADILISYPLMSSTSEMIFRVICRMGYFAEMSVECATCIYLGMMSDTGAFTFNSNHPEIYTIISELIKKGVNKDEVYRRTYSNNKESRYRMLGHLLSNNMRINKDLGVATLWLTEEELLRYNYEAGDTESFVNIPLEIKGVVCSVFFKETEGKIRISFRSLGDVPLNEFAKKYYNGGGHLNASGGESFEPMQETLKNFETNILDLKDVLKKEIERQTNEL